MVKSDKKSGTLMAHFYFLAHFWHTFLDIYLQMDDIKLKWGKSLDPYPDFTVMKSNDGEEYVIEHNLTLPL